MPVRAVFKYNRRSTERVVILLWPSSDQSDTRCYCHQCKGCTPRRMEEGAYAYVGQSELLNRIKMIESQLAQLRGHGRSNSK